MNYSRAGASSIGTASLKVLGAAFVALLLIFGGSAKAAVILFEDDFSDTDLSNWDGALTGDQTWAVVNDELVTDSKTSGFRYFLMDGISTPEQFRLKVDVRNITGASNRPSEQGHGGIVWDQDAVLNNENKTYVRTHGDHLNLYNIGSLGETHAPIISNNGDTIRYVLDVDYIARELLITAKIIDGGNSGASAQIAWSGTDFDNRVRPFNAPGGGIGLLTWGDSVAFDNVVLYDTSVDAPESIALALLGIGLVGLRRTRRRLVRR